MREAEWHNGFKSFQIGMDVQRLAHETRLVHDVRHGKLIGRSAMGFWMSEDLNSAAGAWSLYQAGTWEVVLVPPSPLGPSSNTSKGGLCAAVSEAIRPFKCLLTLPV